MYSVNMNILRTVVEERGVPSYCLCLLASYTRKPIQQCKALFIKHFLLYPDIYILGRCNPLLLQMVLGR